MEIKLREDEKLIPSYTLVILHLKNVKVPSAFKIFHPSPNSSMSSFGHEFSCMHSTPKYFVVNKQAHMLPWKEKKNRIALNE